MPKLTSQQQFFKAVSQGNVIKMEELFKNDPSINLKAKGPEHEIALEMAASLKKGDKVVEYLLSQTQENYSDTDLCRSILKVVRSPTANIRSLQLLLEKRKESHNATQLSTDRNFLHVVFENNKELVNSPQGAEIVKLLLEYGADPLTKEEVLNRTPVDIALDQFEQLSNTKVFDFRGRERANASRTVQVLLNTLTPEQLNEVLNKHQANRYVREMVQNAKPYVIEKYARTKAEEVLKDRQETKALAHLKHDGIPPNILRQINAHLNPDTTPAVNFIVPPNVQDDRFTAGIVRDTKERQKAVLNSISDKAAASTRRSINQYIDNLIKTVLEQPNSKAKEEEQQATRDANQEKIQHVSLLIERIAANLGMEAATLIKDPIFDKTLKAAIESQGGLKTMLIPSAVKANLEKLEQDVLEKMKESEKETLASAAKAITVAVMGKKNGRSIPPKQIQQLNRSIEQLIVSIAKERNLDIAALATNNTFNKLITTALSNPNDLYKITNPGTRLITKEAILKYSEMKTISEELEKAGKVAINYSMRTR